MRTVGRLIDIVGFITAVIIAVIAILSIIQLFDEAPVAVALHSARGYLVVAGILALAAFALFSTFRGSQDSSGTSFEAREKQSVLLVWRMVGIAFLAIGSAILFGLPSGLTQCFTQ